MTKIKFESFIRLEDVWELIIFPYEDFNDMNLLFAPILGVFMGLFLVLALIFLSPLGILIWLILSIRYER